MYGPRPVLVPCPLVGLTRRLPGVNETAPPNEADAPPTHRSRWLPWLCVVALAAAWTIEVYILQSRTLISESGWRVVDYTQAVNYRLLITALFTGSLVLLLPRWAQLAAFLILLLFTQAASFYHHYFGRALSWTTIRTQFGEGAESVVLDKAFVLPGVLALSLLFLVIKLGLLWAQRRHMLRWRVRLPAGALLATGYVVSILLFNAYGNTRLESLRNWMSVDRVGVAHGYLVTWFGEYLYISNAELLDKALAASEQRDDGITPVEGPMDLPGHLVLLQVESLDWHVLGLEYAGQEITPHINALRDVSMVYQVHAVHKNGSADADFVMLHGCMVAPGTINYKIPGFPHSDTLPAAARAAGRPMTVLHGVKGNFYHRRPAFDAMDFEHTIFVEEMVDEFGLETEKWSAVPDEPTLLLSAQLLNAARSPQTHLIITYTSHTPFVMVPDSFDAPFDNPGDRVDLRYFNSIHYVDHAIGEYLDALPEGTTVVIYADHEGAAGYAERQRGRGEPELIPLIVWRKGEDLSTRQVGGILPADRVGEMYCDNPGAWSLIDAANWVRSWLVLHNPMPEVQPGTPHDPPQTDPHETGIGPETR